MVHKSIRFIGFLTLYSSVGFGILHSSNIRRHDRSLQGVSDEDGFFSSEAGLGACYDAIEQDCGCAIDECSEKKCENKDSDRFVWSKECLTSCSPRICPSDDVANGVGGLFESVDNLVDTVKEAINTACSYFSVVLPSIESVCPLDPGANIDIIQNVPGTNNQSDEDSTSSASSNSNDSTAWSPGGCYDIIIHKCGCGEEACSKQKCEAIERIWTEECPNHCDEDVCLGNGGSGSTEAWVSGGCYDVDIHKCGCQEEACSKQKCESISRIWTDECPDHCDEEMCLNGSNASASIDPNSKNSSSTKNETVIYSEVGDLKNIFDTAAELSSSTYLIAALNIAELETYLDLPGPYTLFAPTDAAFLAVDKLYTILNDSEALAELLMNHVIVGKVLSSEIIQRDVVVTAGLETIDIQIEGSMDESSKLIMNTTEVIVLNNNAHIITSDIETTNGIIHVVDNVLFVPTFKALSSSESRDDGPDSNLSFPEEEELIFTSDTDKEIDLIPKENSENPAGLSTDSIPNSASSHTSRLMVFGIFLFLTTVNAVI